MNKSLLIVASLALGTTAIAQDMPAGAPTQGSPPMTNTPSPAMPDSSMPSPSPSGTAGTTDNTGNPPNPQPMDQGMTGGGSSAMPGGAASNGAGMSGTSGMTGGAMATDTSSYPKCTKGVTDKCMQAGGTGHMAGHKMMHKRAPK